MAIANNSEPTLKGGGNPDYLDFLADILDAENEGDIVDNEEDAELPREFGRRDSILLSHRRMSKEAKAKRGEDSGNTKDDSDDNEGRELLHLSRRNSLMEITRKGGDASKGDAISNQSHLSLLARFRMFVLQSLPEFSRKLLGSTPFGIFPKAPSLSVGENTKNVRTARSA